jgi:hypothetical protein
MKKYVAVIVSAAILTAFWFVFRSCSGMSVLDFISGKHAQVATDVAGDGRAQREVAYDPNSEQSIQEFKINERKKRALSRFPGDTIDLMEYILKSYPRGTYLIDFDRTNTYNIPQSAVIYKKEPDGLYVFALIAKSKMDTDEKRVIEKKNVIGYDASYIDFDSTRLGTAIFFLELYKYDGGSFSPIWEDTVPIHGGFNKMTLETWKARNIPYIRVNFDDARYSGHDDYNYFFVNGFKAMPHLLETYEAINRKRTMVDYNHDNYPDYCEYLYVDSGNWVGTPDSVFFVWQQKDSVYVNTRNKKQTRRY